MECTTTDYQLRDAWAEKHQLKLSPTRRSWHAFMGRRVQVFPTDAERRDEALRGGWDDHREVWIPAATSGRGFKHPACYTVQPYDLTDDAIANLAEMARIHGLHVDFRSDAESWYCPGHSKLIAIWRPDWLAHTGVRG